MLIMERLLRLIAYRGVEIAWSWPPGWAGSMEPVLSLGACHHRDRRPLSSDKGHLTIAQPYAVKQPTFRLPGDLDRLSKKISSCSAQLDLNVAILVLRAGREHSTASSSGQKTLGASQAAVRHDVESARCDGPSGRHAPCGPSRRCMAASSHLAPRTSHLAPRTEDEVRALADPGIQSRTTERCKRSA